MGEAITSKLNPESSQIQSHLTKNLNSSELKKKKIKAHLKLKLHH